MPTKTISTFNGVTQAAGVATNLIIAVSSLPTIRSIFGYCNGTANTQYFLQFFNSATVPANATVPLYSVQVLGGNGFGPYNYVEAGLESQQWDDGAGLVAASGLIVCLSTTEATLTIGTGAVTMDIEIAIDSGDAPILSQTKVSGTGVASLQVVATPSTKKLVKFTAKNNGGTDAYVMLFGLVPTAGWTPVQQWKVTAGATITEELGNGFFVIDGNPTTYVAGTGIYLYGSTTTKVFTADVANWDFNGWYIS